MALWQKCPHQDLISKSELPKPPRSKTKVLLGGSSFPLTYTFSRFDESHVTRAREYSSHRKK